jgi:hypothetical protein
LGWTAALRAMSTSWTTPARATPTSSGKLGNLHFIFKTTKRICFVSCVISRRNGVWNRRFGSTYRSHLQGSSCPRSLILEDGTIGCPETAVLNNFTPRNDARDERTQFNCSWNLRSHN